MIKEYRGCKDWGEAESRGRSWVHVYIARRLKRMWHNMVKEIYCGRPRSMSDKYSTRGLENFISKQK